MASLVPDLAVVVPRSPLGDRSRTIGPPLFDALLLWGSPVLAAILVWAWVDAAAVLAPAASLAAVNLLVAAIGVLTFAHLIAVVPRAYLNGEVLAAHRRRLVVVPLVLVPALLLSPALLLVATVLVVFWDVHHTAMQTFGLGRIYDAKAGNGATVLRAPDLALNWLLHVGPIATGASLLVHFRELEPLRATPLALLATAPGWIATEATPIRVAAILAYSVGLLAVALLYRRAARDGYRLPAPKAALLVSTGLTSLLAWSLSPPFVAFAIVNLFHAVQYFALVWLKEGERMTARLRRLRGELVLALFLGATAVFGLAYAAAKSSHVLLAPFIACSLLHFWFDSFVWSVRRRQV